MQKKRDIEPVVTIRKLGDRSGEAEDLRYWLSQSPQARIDHLERLRAEYHGWTEDTQPRLQRVYRVIKLQ